ncbi:MAG: Flp family type IVb pilin [Nocardioidaceae bacterium]
MKSLMARLHHRTARGASSVEYALLAALIAIVIVLGVTAFGSATTGMFSKTCSSVAATTGDTC